MTVKVFRDSSDCGRKDDDEDDCFIRLALRRLAITMDRPVKTAVG